MDHFPDVFAKQLLFDVLLIKLLRFYSVYTETLLQCLYGNKIKLNKTRVRDN